MDTDQIAPARFLWKPRASGYAEVLFHDLRHEGEGVESGFVLNQDAYRHAKIMVAGRNFGCGSSREHAVWALYDSGFRAVIAPSFGDIFYTNCSKNGLLAIKLVEQRVAELLEQLKASPASLHIDVRAQTVAGPDGRVDSFDIDAFSKELIMFGLDEIAFTLARLKQIEAFEFDTGR